MKKSVMCLPLPRFRSEVRPVYTAMSRSSSCAYSNSLGVAARKDTFILLIQDDEGRIIFTHQDLDHVGSGAALVRQSGARVLAHSADAPHIDGSLRLLKPSPEMLDQRPQMREVLERLEPVGVDEHLEDGERLDIAGGTKVIFTPGHTPGHLSLYLERSKVLIAGDALTAQRGYLNGPNPSMTLEMGTAIQSIRRLADLEINTIVCYHGGVVADDANGQLRRVIQEASGEYAK